MCKIQDTAALDHEIFQEATHRSLHKRLDDQARFNRHYYVATGAILLAIIVGGGALLCWWISTLPV
jgi:hypothetical protein